MTGLAQTPGRTAASMAAVTTILSRKLALAAGLVCLATPVLSSCGFDYATDRPNVISNGGFDQTGSGMRVLATRVVADSNDHGVFIATIALNPTADAALASARARLEPELRNAKYKAFAKQWVDDVPAVGLYQPVAEYAVNKHAHSVDPSATLVSAYDRFSNVSEWSVNQKSVYKTP